MLVIPNIETLHSTVKVLCTLWVRIQGFQGFRILRISGVSGFGRGAQLGFGVPYFDTFSGTCYLQGTSYEINVYTFSPWLLQSSVKVTLPILGTHCSMSHPETPKPLNEGIYLKL